MSEIRFYFDFGSPNAYLSHRLLPDIAQRTGPSLRYVPVLLRGVLKMAGNQSPAQAVGNINNKLPHPQL